MPLNDPLPGDFCTDLLVIKDNSDNRITETNKMLGRAQDPRANGAWLSKLTE